jgi:hypothetical protein
VEVPVAEVGEAVTVTVAGTDAVEEGPFVEETAMDDEAGLVDKGDMTRSITCMTPLFVRTFGFVSNASLKYMSPLRMDTRTVWLSIVSNSSPSCKKLV